MSNYKNAFTEVYTILDCLEDDEYNKIPSDILETIKINKNIEYDYELELNEQSMLPETKAILFNLFRDYLSTPEQKEKIIRMQEEERKKNDFKKQQHYNTDVFIKKRTEKQVKETVEIVEYRKNPIEKFINFIRRVFQR